MPGENLSGRTGGSSPGRPHLWMSIDPIKDPVPTKRIRTRRMPHQRVTHGCQLERGGCLDASGHFSFGSRRLAIACQRPPTTTHAKSPIFLGLTKGFSKRHLYQILPVEWLNYNLVPMLPLLPIAISLTCLLTQFGYATENPAKELVLEKEAFGASRSTDDLDYGCRKGKRSSYHRRFQPVAPLRVSRPQSWFGLRPRLVRSDASGS
jgi:hypothetical protein